MVPKNCSESHATAKGEALSVHATRTDRIATPAKVWHRKSFRDLHKMESNNLPKHVHDFYFTM